VVKKYSEPMAEYYYRTIKGSLVFLPSPIEPKSRDFLVMMIESYRFIKYAHRIPLYALW
jgi:hypothetical protein